MYAELVLAISDPQDSISQSALDAFVVALVAFVEESALVIAGTATLRPDADAPAPVADRKATP